MLSIRPIGCSSEQISYYANLGREDYYVNGGEAPGTWYGAGAETLGLSGKVQGEQLRQILLGYSVDGQTKLVQNAGQKNRRSAFDLTWSVPKSVSALWSQSDLDDRFEIEWRCELAVHKAVDAFQSLCGASRRGHDGIDVQEARLAMAIFRHETARGLPGEAPDPNLHWHLVVPNVAIRPDGSTGAFDARKLFQKSMKMALGALFRAELSKQLREMSLESHRPLKPHRDENVSWFELTAVPGKLIAAMSKRRTEIEKWLTKHGLSGAKNAEKAALKTRQNKQPFPREHLFDAWRKLGEEFGLSAEKIKNILAETQLSILDAQKETENAIQRALERITDHEARFTKTELLRFTAEEAQCNGVGIDAAMAEVENKLANDNEIVRLRPQNGEPLFTTKEMLEQEKQLFLAAQRLAGRNRRLANPQTIESKLNRFDTLRTEQAAAIRHITGGNDLTCVNGVAGSGKTYMLKVANEIWRTAGFNVIGTSLAAKAAKTLENDSGIRSTHIHSLLRQIESGKIRLDNRSVLVVDECGMLGTRQLVKLFANVEQSGGIIVLVGDHRQLQAISAGAPFRAVAERVGCLEMNEITRQREPWAREAVYDFRDGRSQNALVEYHARGQLFIGNDRDEAIDRLVADWRIKAINKGQLRETLVFAGTNLDVALINNACQQARLEAGELGTENVAIGGASFHTNDRIVITRNLKALGLKNGSLGTISQVDEEQHSIRVCFDDGLQVWLNLESFAELKLAYAVSTHKGQGQTVENSFVLAGDAMTDRELTYVQASRARGETRLYSDVLNGGPDIESLAAKMNPSRAKKMAHDNDRAIF